MCAGEEIKQLQDVLEDSNVVLAERNVLLVKARNALETFQDEVWSLREQLSVVSRERDDALKNTAEIQEHNRQLLDNMPQVCVWNP